MSLSQPHLMRQFDLIPREALATPITVIGAGAIGSSVTLWLAKMGMEDITVWDPDEVAIENVSCQLYGPEDVGKAKVLALLQLVARCSTKDTLSVGKCKWKVDDELPTKGIVVLAVDDMDTRKAIWEEICQKCFGVTHVIDCRMGSESALMYVMATGSLKDRETYLKTLYKNEDAVQEPCTGKSTGYTSILLSGWAVKAVKDLITKKKDYPRITMWSIKDSGMVVYKKEE